MNTHPDGMTVAALIKALRKLPPDLTVYHQDTVHPNDPAVPVATVGMIPGEGDEPNWVLIF
jgi:hypothetical protein